MLVRLFLALAAASGGVRAQTGALAGVVRETGSGAPLANVSVWAGGDQTKTDDTGGFRFAALTPGTKRLYATDPERGGSANSTAVVRAGAETRVEIRIKLGGSISGRVVDAGKRPVAGVAVLLLRRRYELGEIVYLPAQTAATDAQGEYHLKGVTADQRYLVLAKKLLSATASGEALPFDQRDRVLGPTLYGDSADIRGGQTVVVASREQRTGVDIRLAETAGYCIEGSVETAAKDVVITISEQFWFTAGWNLTPAAVRANAEGAFRACGLHPGEYRLMASSGAPGTSLADRMSGWAGNAIGSGNVQVLDKDVRGIRLTERAPVPIEGDAVYDPPPQGKPGKVSISVSRHMSAADYADSLEKSSAGSLSGGFSTGGGTAVPGPFKLGRLRDGEWELKVSQLAEGCYVKSAAYGQQDLLRSLLRVGEGGGAGRVQVAIGCDGATVTARVTDAAGNPAAAAIVYLIDVEATAPAELAVSMRRAQVTNGWSAPLTAVRPGKYLAVATTLDLGSGSADDMEELWSLRGEAKPVEAGAGAMAQVSLMVVAR